ncbi:MAG TPA: cobalamin-binding protein [Gemmatimonadaceae bacterium]|jgi:iron complex transport system substrate-binding protein
MRIVSFLPAATEMVCALGMEEALVGRSAECDYPASVRDKPVVVHSALSLSTMTPSEIDDAVRRTLHETGTLYAVDEALLRSLEPDLILTQDLCQVCAPSGNEITRFMASLERQPEVLYFTPHTLDDVDDNLRTLSDLLGRRTEADAVIAANRARIEAVEARVADVDEHATVFFAEWVDPLYCAGHWVPEMIEIAGGIPLLARRGGDSVRVTRDEVVAANPDVVIVAPCGFDSDGAAQQAATLDLPAKRVFAVDANAFFARPGPRLIDGIELLAQLLHPQTMNVPKMRATRV